MSVMGTVDAFWNEAPGCFKRGPSKMKSRKTLEELPDLPCRSRRNSSGQASAWPWVLVLVLLQLGLKVAAAQGVGPAPKPAVQVIEEEPIFRLEAEGPSSLVTGLTFAPDGQTLYVTGWDKIVRVWTLDRAEGKFKLDRPATFRVPIGPGLEGAINSLAVSSDAKGEWLAVAGQGLMRGLAAGFRKPGLFIPPTLIPPEMKLDQGQIEVFNTRSNPRRLQPLRGHKGGVLALSMAPLEPGQPIVLASAALEGEESVVQVWDVERGKPLARLPGLPKPTSNAGRPGLVVRRRGAGPREIDVAIAWGDGRLRLWDVATEPAHVTEYLDGAYNVPIGWFGPNGLVTASYDSKARAGQLRSWIQQANGGLGVKTLVQFPAASDVIVDVPRAMAFVGAPPGVVPQQAAILLARLPLVPPGGLPASQIEYLLQLHSLDPAVPGQLRARQPRCRAGIEAANAGSGRRSHRGASGGGVQARSRGHDLLHQGLARRQVGSESNSSQPRPDSAAGGPGPQGKRLGITPVRKAEGSPGRSAQRAVARRFHRRPQDPSDLGADQWVGNSSRPGRS